jgi:dihydrofolate reductase
MSKLVLHMITSIDGFIADNEDNVNPATQWDEEMHTHYLELFTSAGAVVFGRRLYQQYVGHWSRVAAGEIPAGNDIEWRWTRRLMAMPKIVVSTTLSEDPETNTRLVDADIAGRLGQLKAESGSDVLLMCGPALAAHLAAHQLIDEYLLYVCPIAFGRGVHLFRDFTSPARLAHRDTRRFHSGVNLHRYASLPAADLS